jgi:tripartite-type tricarboxylate transporter receptor subunit TctC
MAEEWLTGMWRHDRRSARQMFDTVPSSIEYIRTGKLRPLAVTTTRHLDVLPGVPTVAEFATGYEASGWVASARPETRPRTLSAD